MATSFKTFDSGMSLLESARRADIDFLIADVQMPGMTGSNSTSNCTRGERIPTILITGHPNERDRSQALKPVLLPYLSTV